MGLLALLLRSCLVLHRGGVRRNRDGLVPRPRHGNRQRGVMRRLDYCLTKLVAIVLGVIERLLRYRFAVQQILLLLRRKRLLVVSPFFHEAQEIYQCRVAAV